MAKQEQKVAERENIMQQYKQEHSDIQEPSKQTVNK